jgi:hypothetical protein
LIRVGGELFKLNGTYTKTGTEYLVTAMSYNRAIAAGGNTSFGYCAVKTGSDYHPDVVAVTATW